MERPVVVTRRLDELGRLVIPRVVRDRYNIKPGDEFEVYVNEEGEDNYSIVYRRVKEENSNEHNQA